MEAFLDAPESGVAQPITQWLNKVIELQTRKDWPALIEHSRRWTMAQPGSSMAWYNLGTVYGKAGPFAKTINAHQQALRIDPEYARAWYGLGGAYAGLGQRGKVLEVYTRLKTLDLALVEEFFTRTVMP